jgi:hypothetical protein
MTYKNKRTISANTQVLIYFAVKNQLQILLDRTIKHAGCCREGVWDTKNIFQHSVCQGEYIKKTA